MKKNNTLLIVVLAFFALSLNAQTTIIDDDYTDASYDAAAAQSNLEDHPDWSAGHNVPNGPPNTKTWSANGADQIKTQTNFAYAINQTPITGVAGDVITITVVAQLGNNPQIFNATDANKQLYVTGLSPVATIPAGQVGNILGQNRDGVLVRSDGPGARVFLSDGGPSGFGTQPEISTADKSAYQIIIEYTLGADSGSSTKTARIRNLGSNETSPIGSANNGIRPDVYTALTGSGAYFFNWGLGFVVAGEINIIYNNRILVTKNIPLLSTENFSAFQFEMFPNPVHDVLNIKTQETLEKVEVLDLLGRTVLTVNKIGSSIDVSSLKAAMYVVRLTSNKGVSTKKFIKN
ncbi:MULTISPECIES: T9SS type A sorting domain-containing protein [unclassified Lacinutrix]